MPPRFEDPSPRDRRDKPSKSGADTPRSSPLIAHGGKVDLEALRKAVHSRGVTPAPAQPPHAPHAPHADDSSAPIAPFLTDATDAVAPNAEGGAGGAPDDDAPNRVVFIPQRDLQTRLDKYLVSRISFMSRSQLQRLIDEGGVTVNARKPKASTTLRAGDRIEVFVPPPPATDIVAQDIPLDVLFEDEHIIVLNKRPDIIVHPARSELSGTLINALAWHFTHVSSGALSKVGKEFARPGVVHRLDRDTSGLIVFAKNDEAHWRLARQFETRRVDKRYLALVHGLVEPDVDVIDLPLGPHPSREKGYREKYVVRHDHLGKPSLTIFRVRETYPHAPGAPASRHDGARDDPARGFSLVELELKTGRTHQIRVHLSHLGFPIVGDDMYTGAHDLRRAHLDARVRSGTPDDTLFIARQALHATTLTFEHPVSGERMKFQAPLPPDMAAAVAALRALCPGARRIDPPPPGATVNLDTLVPSP